MVEENGSIMPARDDLVKGELQSTIDGDKVSDETHVNGRRILVPDEVSKIIEHKIDRKEEVPKDIGQVVALSSQFASDMGINPGADVARLSKKVSENVQLRRQITELRQEILIELRELQRRSEKYVHVAESAGHWAIDARRFADSHPNLLWFLKERKGTGTR